MTTIPELANVEAMVLPVASADVARQCVATEATYLGASYLVTPEDGEGPVYAVAGDKPEAERLAKVAADALGWAAGDPYGAESSTRAVWVVDVKPADPEPEPEDAPADAEPPADAEVAAP